MRFWLALGEIESKIEDFVRSIADLTDVRAILAEARDSGSSNGHAVISVRPDFGDSIEYLNSYTPAAYARFARGNKFGQAGRGAI